MKPGTRDPRDAIRNATSASFKPRPQTGFGFVFFRKHNIHEMHAKLIGNLPTWNWSLRDKDTHGEYVMRLLEDDYVRVRIFALPANYHLDVLCVGDAAVAADAMKVLAGRILKEVLPQIAAVDINAAGYFD